MTKSMALPRLRGAAKLLLLAILAASCGGMSGQEETVCGPRGRICLAGDFCWENPSPQGNQLAALWGARPDAVWAVGDRGTILFWNGAEWSLQASGVTVDLEAIFGFSESDVWVVGWGGTVLRWNGQAWSVTPTPASVASLVLGAVWGAASDDVWAMGSGPTALHWDGAAWAAVPNANSSGEFIQALFGSARDNVYAVGTGGAALRWNGSAWSSVTTGARAALHGLFGTSQGSTSALWAVGADGTILRIMGSSFTPVASGTAAELRGVFGTSPSDVWAVGHQVVAHWDGARWTEQRGFSDTFESVWGASGTYWAVGQRGAMYRYDGSGWSRYTVHARTEEVPTAGLGADKILHAVFGTSGDDVWAVGRFGLFLHRDCDGWKQVPSDFGTARTFLAIGGTGGGDLWAAGDGDARAHWDGTGWRGQISSGYRWNAVAALLPSDVWLGGTGSTVRHFDGTTWGAGQVIDPFPYSVNGMWGATSTDIWAVGTAGRMNHFDGTTWRIVPPVTSSALQAVSGTASADVWAVGNTGVAIHFDGTSWREVATGIPENFTSLWAVASNDVWAVAAATGYSVIVHWNGSSWRRVTEVGPLLNGIWADRANVFAVGEAGTILRLSR